MNEQKEIAPEVLENVTEILNDVSNEQVVECILAWENNPFAADGTKDMLLQHTKEANIELLIGKLHKYCDHYILSFIAYLIPYSKNSINLENDLQAIIQEIFEEFGLTNNETQQDHNRLQINDIYLNLKPSIDDFVEERLINHFVDEDVDDEDIESLKVDIFAGLMIDMLYFESGPGSLQDHNKAVKSLLNNEG